MTKKILIISKDRLELSTEDVMDWVIHLGHEVERVNGDWFELFNKHIQVISQDGELRISIDNQSINQFHSIWFRRWSDYDQINELVQQEEKRKVNYEIVSNLFSELNAVKDFIIDSIVAKNKLTTIDQVKVNKLIVFREASRIGFAVPKYIITTLKDDLIQFRNRIGKVVVKDINYQLMIQREKEQVLSYAEIINEKFIDDLPQRFILSLFQEYIEKEFEIRSFFLNNKVYSMVIFSQNDKKTQVDFRKYNMSFPNRTIPYQLPKIVEDKMIKLMEVLNLTTGSFDLIKTPDGKYVFLEVNPVGQFGMVSYPCNYNLEKEIANFLIA